MTDFSSAPTDLFPDTGPAAAGPSGVMEVIAADRALAESEAGRRGRRRRRGKGIMFWMAVGWIGLVAFCAIFADYLPFVRSYSKIYPAFKKPPSTTFWFGTDKIGHDVFARTVYGARLSLAIAGASIILGLFFGGIFGLAAGYYRRKVDTVISTGVDIMLAFPALILLLAITAFLKPSARTVILALAILSIAPLTRIVRANTMVYSQREFVLAAKSLGAKDRRILFREVLPNIVPAMLAFALTGLAVLIVAEGALAFLGQSVPPPIPTWGKLIDDGRQDLETAWWISLLPAAVMFLTILAFNIMGDVLAKRFDIREAVA
jgi:peptide/nickel transport system permease protein